MRYLNEEPERILFVQNLYTQTEKVPINFIWLMWKELEPMEISLIKNNMTNEENMPFVRHNGRAPIYNIGYLFGDIMCR